MRETIEQRLREESRYKDKATLEIMDLCIGAADAIEQLKTENAALRKQLAGKAKEFHETVNAQIMELDWRQIVIDQWRKRCDEQGKEIERLSTYGVGRIKWGDLKKLEADLACVTAERDAAIEDISHLCSTCGEFKGGTCPVLGYKGYPTRSCGYWNWRGARKGDGEDDD